MINIIPFKLEHLEGLRNTETFDYVQEALQYWIENKFIQQKQNPIFTITSDWSIKQNVAFIFARIDGETFHISRVTVVKKGDGFGSLILQKIQEDYEKITLWSNQKARSFYEKNGFIFDDNQTVEVGLQDKDFTTLVPKEIYTYGEWNKS